MDTGRRTIPEAILLEILARLPLRSIARFKSVCKTWKSVIESPYFRRLCTKTHLPPGPNLPTLEYFYRGSSNGLIWIEIFVHKSFVGNPVLQEWLEIPPPPEPCLPTGLVTRVDEEGLVSSFKVVRTCESRRVYERRVYVYSSERGTWTFKRLLSSIPLHHPGSYPPVNLNGMLYLCKKGSYRTGPGVLIAHDFYGPEADDQCRVIPLPPEYNMISCLTTSRGDVIYIEILDQRLKVWRLNSERWQLSREEIDMASVGFDVDCIPMAMNPFDSDIIYLWSLEHCCFVSGNLRTHEFIVHQESENWSSSKGCCRINTSGAEGYMEYARYLFSVVMLSQFVLPQWMDPVPRPPN